MIAFAIVAIMATESISPRHGMRRRRESSDLYFGDGSTSTRPANVRKMDTSERYSSGVAYLICMCG